MSAESTLADEETEDVTGGDTPIKGRPTEGTSLDKILASATDRLKKNLAFWEPLAKSTAASTSRVQEASM